MSVESFRGPGAAQLYYRYDDFTDPWEDAPTAVLCHGHPRNSNLWLEAEKTMGSSLTADGWVSAW